MFSCGDVENRRLTVYELSVEVYVINPIGIQMNILVNRQHKILMKIHQDKMAFQFPERRQECAALRAPVLHFIAQPNLVVARVPYPGSFLRGSHAREQH